MRKINLLIIGEQKCGTHSLKYCLNEHSNINFMQRECHVFDNMNNIKKYEDYLDDEYLNYTKYYGECTPLYLYNTDSIPNSLNYNKDMKYIVVLRDPVKRARSAYEMLKRGNHEKDTFENVIQEQLQTLSIEESTEFEYAKKHYIKRGFYIEQLKRLYGLVNKKNIHVVISENLWNNTDEELKKIFKFLDVDSEKIMFPHSNSGNYSAKTDTKTDTKTEEILRNLYKEKNKELEHFLGISLPWNNNM